MPPKAAKARSKTPKPTKKEPEPKKPAAAVVEEEDEDESGSEDEEMEESVPAQNANNKGEDESNSEEDEEDDDEDEEEEEDPPAQNNVQKDVASEKKTRGRPKVVHSDSMKKKKKINRISYSHFIYKVLKQIHPEMRISGKSMNIMNDFVQDIFERIASEGSNLSHRGRKQTMTSREIDTATKLILPGELARHAENEGKKSIANYLRVTEEEKVSKSTKNVPKKSSKETS
ncbi:hypothetical protein PVAND_000739 [Polypedilum vanderplanki]|uniref:Core Histone H2A/H2B/H3 domain-containing protein n=1 Tax=Polypedilum vanderplanki TaxID=319348 RepID=A0A9J6BL33_POLVA|nr:hypothetical protein PVAND_000739 [Polypedilum vanderplanki]